MLTDTLQEILEVRHGNFLYLLAQLWDVIHHDLAEAVVAHLGQVGVLEMLQGLQRRVVSGESRQSRYRNNNNNKKKRTAISTPIPLKNVRYTNNSKDLRISALSEEI